MQECLNNVHRLEKIMPNKKDANDIFSLLTVCCNGSKYIEDWAKSITKQAYRPLEVIFYDDKSTDDSIKKVLRIKKRFKRQDITLRVYEGNKKRRYGGGLREAAKLAAGSFYGILDIDDALTEGAVGHVMMIYQQNPGIGHVYTQMNICDCDLSFKKTGFSRAPRQGMSILSEGLLHDQHVYSHFRTFSRRVPRFLNIFDKHGRFAIDQYMGLSLEQKARGMFSQRVCYLYRSGCPGTISSKYGGVRREFWYKLLNRVDKYRKHKKIKVYPIESV